MNAIQEQNLIQDLVFAFYLSNGHLDDESEFTLGSINPNRFQGPVYYFPVIFKAWWVIGIQSMALNLNGRKDLLGAKTDRSKAQELEACKVGKCRAIVDSGTSLITMPTTIYVDFLAKLSAVLDLDTCKVKDGYDLASMSLEFQFLQAGG